MVLQRLLIGGLNHLIAGESWAGERLRQHVGARVMIDAGVRFHLRIDEHGLFQSTAEATETDVCLTLPKESLVHAAVDRDKLFSSVKLSGTADIAETLAFVLRNLRWDAEGDLAAIIGDIPARRLALTGRSLAEGAGASLRKLAENFQEYAVDETRVVVSRDEVGQFRQMTDALSERVSGLEKRISRLS